jgi:predicted ATPase with chaperone activity
MMGDVPHTGEDTGVPTRLLQDLALKVLFLAGEFSLHELADAMRLDLEVVESLFQRLRKEELCRVTGMVDGVHRIVATSEGRTRALELLSLNRYAGPAPVSLADYVAQVRAQSVRNLEIRPPDVQRAFAHLVLDRETLSQLGTAVASGKAVFLYGPTGTGKSSVADGFTRLFDQDRLWLPYAVEVDGQIITVYDPHVHARSDGPAPHPRDRRWVLCRRPRVLVGGELTPQMLDLDLNPVTKYYAAPVQMKANNGFLIVDDFGRQRVRPDELLNRWVVPFDRGIDFLTLIGGAKIEMPFDVIVVFATNLDPSGLFDEAFLRRMQTKIKLGNVARERFHEIFRRVCTEFGLTHDAVIVDELIEVISGQYKQPLRPCYPRDIVQQICWAARYEAHAPRLDRDTLVQACRNYFISPE